jgi:hypothetical protein
LSELAGKDHRIQVVKPWEHSGTIGKLKNWACSLGNGQILVELDHDDELCEDFVWDEENAYSDLNVPNLEVESHVTGVVHI